MLRLANMSLILRFTLVKGSMCCVYVQAKQHHKPAEERNLAPHDLIHSDLCKMNSELTKGEKKHSSMIPLGTVMYIS
jgi:hypothetical protein